MAILPTIRPNRCSLGLWALALLLVLGVMSVCGNALAQAAESTVTFRDYDMTELSDISLPSDIPDGATLYTAGDLASVAGFQAVEGCTWYLYKEAAGEEEAFGPVAIPDPKARAGYEFYDWACLNATRTEDLHTVHGNTVFLARYARGGQYLVSFYYQYDDENRSVAAPTTSAVGGLKDSIAIELPDTLDGLTPQICCLYDDETAPGVAEAQVAAAQLSAKIQNGRFSTALDEEFLALCRTAWFVDWDTETDNYKTDSNGVVRINIPVVYKFDGTTSFQVHYYLQGADDPRSYEPVEADFETVTLSGSTHVSLEELGLVKEYEGFSLNAASQVYAASYTVNPNGTTVIDLHYDREVYYLTYTLHGGTLQEPVGFRYGQTLPTGQDTALLAPPVRAGYTFDGWTIRTSDGRQLDQLPVTMPACDLVLDAAWTPAQTTVTITYWLENANDADYTPVGKQNITVPTEVRVGYVPSGQTEEGLVNIASYLTAESMKTAGITDGSYFSLVTDGDKALPTVTAAGDGSTTLNAYYDRKEYTLVFHIGWISDGTNGTIAGNSYISTSGNSNMKDAPENWTSGYSSWKAADENITLVMKDKTYQISNELAACYQITAKYGAFIGDQWPVASEETVPHTVTADNTTYQLFTWGTHAASPYFQNREESRGNKNIMGVYSTMSSELIIDPNKPTVAHHLTAYWAKSENKGANGSGIGEYKIHHYLFEAVPGAVEEGTTLVGGNAYGTTAITAANSFDPTAIASTSFYEYQTLQVRTTHTSAGQNPPAFANLTFRYGCYQGADVYFFYTYNDYTLTYDENNPDLTASGEENHQTVTFHYVGGKLLRDTLIEPGFNCAYTPEQPYRCQYGNAHLFAGWYKDPACAIPIDWDTVASESSVTAYAKWESPVFDLTLEVPGGQLPAEILESIREKGYVVEAAGDGQDSTYLVRNVADGTPINQILSATQLPESYYGLPFQAWYETEEDGMAARFLFDDTQVMNDHRTLTAHWAAQNTGVYVVRYLTAQDPGNGLGTVEAGGSEYYRLQPDETVSGLAVGSTVTLEPRLVSAYLPTCGRLTHIITGDQNAPTVFAFVYTPMGAQTVTYTVHYVLDTGEDYGRTAAEQAIALSDSATFTLSASGAQRTADTSRISPRSRSADGTITGTVWAMAALVPGYVPRDGYQANLVLSSTAAENHLYFYYVSNADAGTSLGLADESDGLECQVQYFLWNSSTGVYQKEACETMLSKEGTILYTAPYAAQYLLEKGSPNLAVDPLHTPTSVVVEGGTTILPIYLKAPVAGEVPDTSWDQPEKDLPPSQPEYTPTPPPAPTPDIPESGNDGNGDDDSGSNTGGNTGGSTPVQYTLSYESNGGTVYPAEQYAANTVVTLDKVPLRAGCCFTGWYADQALTQPISTVTMTASCTVYAGWEPSAVPDLLNGTDHIAYVIGYPDGTVRPLTNVTRAEVAVIFFRLLDPEVRTATLTSQEPFTDVVEGVWYQSAVATLHALGIFQGRTDTVFDGGAPITRAEFAAVCARFDRSGTTGSNSFTDLDGHWAQEEIGCAAALGWILGYEDGTFRPDRPITRAEAVSMVNRVLHRLPETAEDLLEDMTVWPDNPPQAWYYLAVQEATNTHTYQAKNALYETWTQRLKDPDWTQYQ